MRNVNLQPVFYFPTSTLMLDDDMDFLNALTARFKSSQNIIATTSVEDAIGILKERFEENYFTFFSKIFTDLSEHNSYHESDILLGVNFDKMNKIFSDVSKESFITNVIVDYAMPQMSGLEFCERIKHLSVKKILLTGMDDKNLAVEAFNKGLIDSFILKNPSTIIAEVSDALKRNQNDFFYTISKSLIDLVWSTAEKNNVLELLKTTIAELNIKQYYIADKNGSFLLVTYSGEQYFLIILPEKCFLEMLSIAEDNDASRRVLHALQTKTAYPLIISEEDRRSSVATWDDKLFSVNKINGSSELHYGIVKYKDNYA